MSLFIPGLQLSQLFYEEVVSKLIQCPHAAALIGEGSEVLGYDQPRSTDHSWGPRLQIFVSTTEVGKVSMRVDSGLPDDFMGYPVRFFSWQNGTVQHHVQVTTLEEWLASQLRIHGPDPLTPQRWLSLPQQHLLQFTAGAVFHDDAGELTRMRGQLAWYPQDIWLWMLASQWHLIGNLQPLIGRTAEAGDLRGSVLIACTLVRRIMEMCFLQERTYWPYPKWFGTAFSHLAAAPAVEPVLDRILAAADTGSREQAVNQALIQLAERHNALGITPEIPPQIADFQVGINGAVRPYPVLNTGSYVEACRKATADSAIARLVPTGAIDQLTHADDALINFTSWPERLNDGYAQELKGSAGSE